MTEIHGLSSLLRGSLGRTSGLNISPGQILYGTVLEVDGGKALLLLQGIDIVAELETSLLPGERVVLQVEEQLPNGQHLLKKLPVKDGGEGFGQKAVDTFLRHFGMKQNDTNRALADEILQNRLPATEKSLNHLSNFAAENRIPPEDASALIWLWSKNMPLSKDSVEALSYLMKNTQRGGEPLNYGSLRNILPLEGENASSLLEN
ncbi:MAG: hypothetical protein GX318_07165, partial [Clostridia bacterium]|nr:hypothetical protein [Clostridia bacterium]